MSIDLLRMRCECIITCDNSRKEFNRLLDSEGVDAAFAFLRRAKRSVIQSQIPVIEEWYNASFKPKEE